MPRANTVASRRCDGHAPLGDDAQHQSDERAVVGHDQVLRIGERRRPVHVMMVEDDHLHTLARAQGAEITETIGVRRVDNDQTMHAVEIHVGGVDGDDLLGVEVVELAHVAVHGLAQADMCDGVQACARRPWQRKRRNRCWCVWR